MKSRHGRQHRLRRRHRRESRARAQRRHPRHRDRACLADRSADHQHMPVVPLVRFRRTRPNQRRKIARSNHVQMQRRNNGLLRRTDSRHISRPIRQQTENMRRTRRRERDDRIRPRDDSRRCGPIASASAPEGMSTAITGAWQLIQNRDRIGVKPAHRRLEARAQNRIEIQIRRQRQPHAVALQVLAGSERQSPPTGNLPNITAASPLQVLPDSASRMTCTSCPSDAAAAPPRNRRRRCSPCRRKQQSAAPRRDARAHARPRPLPRSPST